MIRLGFAVLDKPSAASPGCLLNDTLFIMIAMVIQKMVIHLYLTEMLISG